MGVQERKDREKKTRRREILTAAKKLFMQKGFYSTTIDDIARKTELSPGTIYLYFKNKEELYGSLNLIALQHLFNGVKTICDNNKLSFEEKMFKFKDAMYDTFKYDTLVWRNILHIQLEDPLLTLSSELLDQLTRVTRNTMTMIANVYEEGFQQKKFIRCHRMAITDMTWALFSGLVLLEESKKKLNPKRDFLKSTLDMAFDIFIRGIKTTGEVKGK